MALDPVTAGLDLVSNVGGKLIDRLFPDKVAQAKEREDAALSLLQVQNDSEVKRMQTEMSAILAEAQSTDPWTSRARPSFLYVIYVMVLASIPMGILSAINPVAATNVANGMQSWLIAIPDSLWAVFGTGYLGYVGARSYDKTKEQQIKAKR